MNKVKVPINERIASKLITENENNLKGIITETRTTFVNENNEPVFEMHKQMKDEGEYVSYFGFFTEHKLED